MAVSWNKKILANSSSLNQGFRSRDKIGESTVKLSEKIVLNKDLLIKKCFRYNKRDLQTTGSPKGVTRVCFGLV